jgi:2-amino-4-hydroxy-6-hydroxymethyldihydropteridine diphosphokinase
MVTSYIGLGSNLGDREETLRAAVGALAAVPGVVALRVSTFRETAPWGAAGGGQPPYVNGVAEIRTSLPAEDLLGALRRIEARFGRVRPYPGAPRTLDLDLLLYGDRVIRTPDLVVPHPRLAERRFVLEPLAELAPDLPVPPSGTRVRSLLAALPAPEPP